MVQQKTQELSSPDEATFCQATPNRCFKPNRGWHVGKLLLTLQGFDNQFLDAGACMIGVGKEPSMRICGSQFAG